MIKIIFGKLKSFFVLLGNLFLWLAPLSLFLAVTYLPKLFWNLGFKDYLDFLKILVWPFTIVTILFFFKKVVTYLFFSMDEFNFFGAKGNLKNVNEVILEEVNKRFLDKEKEEKREHEMDNLSADIKKKEAEIKEAKGTADENLDLAKETLSAWKKSTEQSKKTILELNMENKRLKEIVSGLSPTTPEVSSTANIDDNKTSDPILEETSVNK